MSSEIAKAIAAECGVVAECYYRDEWEKQFLTIIAAKG